MQRDGMGNHFLCFVFKMLELITKTITAVNHAMWEFTIDVKKKS